MYVEMAILLGITCGSFCAYVASQKNRSAGGWFVAGLFCSIFALIAICGTPIETKQKTDRTGSEFINEIL